MTLWTEENVARLREMWMTHSATMIAMALDGHATRMSVIGKGHRLQLPAKGKRWTNKDHKNVRGNGSKMFGPPMPKPRRKPKQRPQWASGPQLAPTPVVEPPPPQEPPLMVSLMNLKAGMCKFPIGDPRFSDFGFCGHKQFGQSPYCHFHYLLAYQPVTDRRREAA